MKRKGKVKTNPNQNLKFNKAYASKIQEEIRQTMICPTCKSNEWLLIASKGTEANAESDRVEINATCSNCDLQIELAYWHKWYF